jgi:hypothetical protein
MTVGLPREAASKMLASTTNRESVPSSARRTKTVKVFLTPPSSRFCRIHDRETPGISYA